MIWALFNLISLPLHVVDDEQIVNLLVTTSGINFHSSKFLLALVLDDYHLCSLDLQNESSRFLEYGHNWFMSSFILSSKSEISNMIFKNK